MRPYFTQIWLCLQLYVLRIWAFPNGASTTSCGSMIPGHGSRMTSLDAYSLDTGGVTEYTPGTPITVTIRGGAFSGLLLQARDVNRARTEPLGTFRRPDPASFIRQLKCNHVVGSAITHSTTSEKIDSVVVWNPPDTDVGEIQFVATVARSEAQWWRDIRSQLLVYRAATVPTSLITIRPTPVLSVNRTASSGNSITMGYILILSIVHGLAMLLE